MEHEKALRAAFQHIMVSEVARLTVKGLLDGCSNRERLSVEVVHQIFMTAGNIASEYLRELSLPYVFSYWERFKQGVRPVDFHQTVLESVFVSACNTVGFQWMTNFLVYPMGKQHVARASWRKSGYWCREFTTWSEDSYSGLVEQWQSTFLLHRQVSNRDGTYCLVTGSNEVALTQILPKTRDPQKWEDFKHKASIFFDQAFDDDLREVNLDSPDNAILLAPEWSKFFDDGRFVLQNSMGEYHIVCTDDSLMDEPHFQAVARYDDPYNYGENLKLQLHHQNRVFSTSRLNSKLVEIHSRIVSAWAGTGLGPRLVAELDWVDKMPLFNQNIELLGHLQFSNILHHRLELL